MKRIILCILSVLALIACDPIVDNKEPGGILPESELQLDVHATTEGGNEIVMRNNTPGVGSYWDYIVGISADEAVKASLPFLGEQTITFSGLCAGGLVTTTRKVTITKIDHPVAEEWALFAGTGSDGKSWVWDDQHESGLVYGAGCYLGYFAPEWSSATAEDVYESGFEMLFDLNGGPNYTKLNADGKVVEKGTFKFDMSKQKVSEDVGLWAIGQLKLTGASVLNAHFAYDNPKESEAIYTFDILQLSKDKLVLCYAPDGTEAWGDATFWCFRRK